jgi:hypothetical protein
MVAAGVGVCQAAGKQKLPRGRPQGRRAGDPPGSAAARQEKLNHLTLSNRHR